MSTKQPTSLVKFTDADTAIKILTDAKFRWSAPYLLKDPFELNHRSNLSFDSKGLLLACVKATLGLIFTRDEPVGNSPLIKAVRRWRTEQRFDTEDEAAEVLNELLASMVSHRDPELLQVMKDWKQYSGSLRLLCLSESHENLSLWENYGNRHTGIAIRIACGEDSNFERPAAVKYSDTKPEISTLNEQVEALMKQEELNIQEYFTEKFLCKPKSHSNEKEWRLLTSVNTDPADESSWFEDIGFATTEIRAVYLGAGIQEAKKQKILSLLDRQYPKVKQFQAAAMSNKFELDFQRLSR